VNKGKGEIPPSTLFPLNSAENPPYGVFCYILISVVSGLEMPRLSQPIGSSTQIPDPF
jgi:hypothetical protein